jgi:4-hydroxybenzoate polyprenyltransferase
MSDVATVVSERARERSFFAGLSFLVQVSRPGLWSTTALFYLMPLGHWTAFGSATFWIGLFYILFPLGLLLYGVNDIADAEADRFNPRKGTFLFGSLGRTEQLAALRWQIVLVQFPFLAFFFFLVGWRILWWLVALICAVGLYNAPRFGWKGRPPFDVLIQASYLLVFVLSSWLNRVPQLPWQTFVFGALFAMHSHVFGEVMDIAPDRLIGRRTTATVIGAVRAKLLMAVILSVEVGLVYFSFQTKLVPAFLGAGAVWFVLDALVLWKHHAYKPLEMRAFMWAWNATSLAAIYWDWANATLTHAKPFVAAKFL